MGGGKRQDRRRAHDARMTLNGAEAILDSSEEDWHFAQTQNILEWMLILFLTDLDPKDTLR